MHFFWELSEYLLNLCLASLVDDDHRLDERPITEFVNEEFCLLPTLTIHVFCMIPPVSLVNNSPVDLIQLGYIIEPSDVGSAVRTSPDYSPPPLSKSIWNDGESLDLPQSAG